MFSTAFNTILRSIAIPIVAIIILRSSPLGFANSVLAVCITLTLVNILSLLFQIIAILPNMVMLKGWKVAAIVMRMSIEFFSVIGFWVYYLSIY